MVVRMGDGDAEGVGMLLAFCSVPRALLDVSCILAVLRVF